MCTALSPRYHLVAEVQYFKVLTTTTAEDTLKKKKKREREKIRLDISCISILKIKISFRMLSATNLLSTLRVNTLIARRAAECFVSKKYMRL